MFLLWDGNDGFHGFCENVQINFDSLSVKLKNNILLFYPFAFEIQDFTYIWFLYSASTVFSLNHILHFRWHRRRYIFLRSKLSDTFTSLFYLRQHQDENCLSSFIFVRFFNMNRDNCVIHDENTPLYMIFSQLFFLAPLVLVDVVVTPY